MDAGKLFGRSLSFPPRVENGRMVWSEGEANVRESIQVILLTELGERLRLPAFGGGLHEFFFEPNTVTTRQLIADRITQAISRWEPRVTIDSVIVEPDAGDPQSAVATLIYTLVATQARERVQLSVALGQ
jgi:uncharacterized protein